MKILYITNMYPVSDYVYFGIHVKEQIEAIDDVGPVERQVYFINGRDQKWNYIKSIREISKILRQGNFDLVHIHYGLSGLFLLFHQPKIPVIITLHSGELYRKKGLLNHLMQKTITLNILQKAAKIIVLNDDMLSLLGAHAPKLIKQPCGTDLQLFCESQRLLSGKKIQIGFPGNKSRPEKNYTLFSEIVQELGREYDLQIIEFHNLSRSEVVDQLNQIDLLLMTSLVEGSPQIIKEAMACNKPIISTAVGDVADVLSDVQNCFVIHSFKAADFLQPARKILDLPVVMRRSTGREKLLSMGLASEQVARKIYQTYQLIKAS